MNLRVISRVVLCIFLLIFNNKICFASTLGPEVSAPSYILMEQSTGKVISEKNSCEVRFVASVMKTMILLLAVEAIDSGKISENDTVTISDLAAETPGANVWLKSGETITVKDLIKSVAMVSANDACIALAEFIGGSEGKFIAMLNERAKELGMENTIFKDCVGSDEDGNVTSCRDIALASMELMDHKCAYEYVSSWIDHIRDSKTQIVNTNKLLKIYQGTIGIKTGTSEKAGSCISACAERDEMRLICVVLGAENSKDRFKDVSILFDYGFSGYTMIEPDIPEDFSKSVKIKNGMLPEVFVNPQIEGKILVPRGKEKEVACKMTSDDLTAPIDIGSKIGVITYKLGDDILAEYDVLSSCKVDKISFYLVLKKALAAFLTL